MDVTMSPVKYHRNHASILRNTIERSYILSNIYLDCSSPLIIHHHFKSNL